MPSRSLSDLHAFLRSHLLTNIIPFWMKHAIDPAGGINTCIRDDGSLVSRDKWLWSQWRAVWVFSHLYRCHEQNPRYLEIARHIARFAAKYGWDDQVRGWVLRVSGDGEVQAGYDSVYVDGFAIYGLTELALAGGDAWALDLARKTAEAVIPRLSQRHETLPSFPYPTPPGARVHGFPMMFSLCLQELYDACKHQPYADLAAKLQDEVMRGFYRADIDMVVERIAEDWSTYPGHLGSTVVPGHAIEDMWFQMHVALSNGRRELIPQCIRLIKRHLEIGWDAEYGGILLAIDAHGGPEIGWKFADTKLWWPHTEAMYACLLAHEHCREPWCLDWYWKVHDLSFKHYPVPEHGEWTQKLDRQFRKITDVVALPVKDPFHLPRAIMLCVESLARMTAK
jgi:N-acylglucosamine 2-epimerase